MRSKTPFVILKYAQDGGIYFRTNNGKWTENANPGFEANQTKFWNNSGNAWRAITKLAKAHKENFDFLFVWSQNGLAPFTEDDAISYAVLLAYTTDQGEIDAIADEAFKMKQEQIELLDETLTELRVATNFPNSED